MYLRSTVQLGFDFLSPESVGEAAKLAEEIRSLPNDHEAKLQVLEVGKISLYAATSAIKEVQKLVLDPKLGAEIGFEDPNLTAAVSENLEKVSKQRDKLCLNSCTVLEFVYSTCNLDIGKSKVSAMVLDGI